MNYPDELVNMLEEHLRQLRFNENAAVIPLTEAMRYSLLAGGKRVRPTLLMATGQAFGMSPALLLPSAAAVEMIHTYSLIHDDLPSFDNDELRRGKPTCHIKFGENVAILAGDALFAEAFRIISQEQEADPVVKLKVIEEISISTGVTGMVGGQYLDVSGIAPEIEYPLQLLHSLKTGRLIMACVHCGGLLAGAPRNQLEKLRVFAQELGLLFQIKDDILDVIGETAVLGKPAGTDARLMRNTYASVYGLKEAGRLAAESHGNALKALATVDGDTDALAGITDYIFERQL